MKKFNKKGFTLIEMLVVIAVIAVLVSIVIPTVGNSTEKAAEAADAANIRSTIAELTTNALSSGVAGFDTVTIKQKTKGWVAVTEIGGLDSNEWGKLAEVVENDVVKISCTDAGKCTVEVNPQ